jgi:hypothetical protein
MDESQDIFSWNVEQSRHDTHNMIPVLMSQHGYTLQEAVDYVGELCRQCIERFEAQRRQLPSWGPQVDADVQKYVLGLQHWIVGSLHWSFDSERYFGKSGLEVKKTRIVHLLPKRPLDKQGKPISEEDCSEGNRLKEKRSTNGLKSQERLLYHAGQKCGRLGRLEKALLGQWLQSQPLVANWYVYPPLTPRGGDPQLASRSALSDIIFIRTVSSNTHSKNNHPSCP